MKKLIVIRHGDYDATTGGLTELGKRQIKLIADKVKELNAGCASVRLFSSTAKRAKESADIIAARLGLLVEKQNVFYSAGGQSNLDGAINFIRSVSEEADFVIIMTHSELAGEIPLYYGLKILQISRIEYLGVSKGIGTLLDFESKTSRRIVP